MKIMLITQLPPPSGGIATWSKKYLQYCKEHAIDISVVNNAMIGKRGSDFHAKKNLFTEVKRMFKMIEQIVQIRRTEHPNVVHFNTSCSPFGIIRDYFCSVVIGQKIPIILHCRCTVQDQLHGSKVGIFFFRLLVKQAKIVLVLNQQSATYVKTITGKNAIKVANFIDEAYIKSDQKEIGKEIQQVVYTGHVQKTKGIDEILETARSTSNIKYLLVGQVSDGYKDRDIPSNVVMTGNLSSEEVKAHLDSSDLFLFPSYTEGFANSLTEAMARGLPCIASCAGANEDMLESRGGTIVPIADSNAIMDAIKVMNSREIREKMSQWNIQKVQQEYTISKVMEKLISIYQKAINE